MESLEVDFVGTVKRVSTSLTFGRHADLCLDEDNRHMHRVCGEFQFDGESAWLVNRGSATRISIRADSGTNIDLPPGERTTLNGPGGSVSFEAGTTPYELWYQLVGWEARVPVDPETGAETVVFGAELSNREIDYLVAFARPQLEGGTGVPSYAEVAALWNVSAKTIDNTVRHLREKLRASDVGDIEKIEGLIDHLLGCGKISREQLEWASFDRRGGPRPARDR